MSLNSNVNFGVNWFESWIVWTWTMVCRPQKNSWLGGGPKICATMLLHNFGPSLFKIFSHPRFLHGLVSYVVWLFFYCGKGAGLLDMHSGSALFIKI